jgi:hypothetical protein
MLKIHRLQNCSIAELVDDPVLIADTSDILDFLGEAGFEQCNSMILHEENLHPDFFRLHKGIAGEILQKFSTYSFRLAIIGEFSKFSSNSLQDFIRESNRGNRIFFLDNIDDALEKLSLMDQKYRMRN